MNCVDFGLKTVEFPGEWSLFQQGSFICHNCLKIYKGMSNELYHFPDLDLTYHRHSDGTFYRALGIGEKGAVEISPIDSVEENVLQLYAIVLKNNDFTLAGNQAELSKASQSFFEAMRQQRRDFSDLSMEIKLWDDDV